MPSKQVHDQWIAKRQASVVGFPAYRIETSDGELIAIIPGDNNGDQEKDRSNLIRSAPDMLAALEYLAAYYDCGASSVAIRVIAKAKGESNV